MQQAIAQAVEEVRECLMLLIDEVFLLLNLALGKPPFSQVSLDTESANPIRDAHISD
eukprot:CAMPEP_0180559024 /NCGR_PEP_ID=MMETSP1037_2-20121125/2070_1 /TAXON_ID=632150 /ORGANISM="Azadinium spinosum, Strain 3D9" /LENGTH=56 /DNA_ID=CAMNT_0022575457 /DNA_START=691 /DNA_END=861 /DNA_ORIENTATION=+